jgi:hypothetical protein
MLTLKLYVYGTLPTEQSFPSEVMVRALSDIAAELSAKAYSKGKEFAPARNGVEIVLRDRSLPPEVQLEKLSGVLQSLSERNSDSAACRYEMHVLAIPRYVARLIVPGSMLEKLGKLNVDVVIKCFPG